MRKNHKRKKEEIRRETKDREKGHLDGLDECTSSALPGSWLATCREFKPRSESGFLLSTTGQWQASLFFSWIVWIDRGFSLEEWWLFPFDNVPIEVIYRRPIRWRRLSRCHLKNYIDTAPVRMVKIKNIHSVSLLQPRGKCLEKEFGPLTIVCYG